MAPDDLSDPQTVGDYVAVDRDPSAPFLQDADDGGSWVEMPGETAKEGTPPDEGFYSNLAEVLTGPTRDRIVQDLLPRIDEDKLAREKRTDLYAEGIRRTGLGDDAPGGAAFKGASKVVHPMLTEACIDYQARVIRELWPVAGPVKAHILGDVTAEKQARADRKAAHMNYQLKEQMKEAKAVMETTLMQVPLGGSQFIRQWWDHRFKRPRWQFAPIDAVIVAATAEDFASAQRKTFVERITSLEYRQRVDQGQYLDDDPSPPGQLPDRNPAQIASDKVEGVTDTGQNLDGDRELYETTFYLEATDDLIEEIGGETVPEQAKTLYPYIVTMDPVSRKMLAMYRDWENGDDGREPIEHLFEFPFLPWRGVFSLGFPHVIGGLSGAATGALRALLDSAHANNVQSALVLKGSGISGQSQSPEIGTLTEVEGGNTQADDIRKLVLPAAFNQPSPVLMQLLGFLVEAGKGVVRTSLDDSPADAPSPNTPVGTQMSRVEEGLTVFTAIHGRAHAALNRLLKGLARLNRLYLPDVLRVTAETGEIMVRRTDYDGPSDVTPTSDPSIYSDQQRFAQLNYIQGRAQLMPQLYKQREVELTGLRLIKWPNPEGLLQDEQQPHELNAVNENLAMALGRPVQVFPEQDHLAHLQTLLDFMKSPVLGMSPIIAKRFLPAALDHAAQHIVFLYVEQTVNAVEAAAGENPALLMSKDPQVKRAFDALLATAAMQVTAAMPGLLASAEQVLMQATQMLQQMMPQPPLDPAKAAVEAAKAETERKGTADAGNLDIKRGDQDIKRQEVALKAKDIEQKGADTEIDAVTKLRVNKVDSETALRIAQEKLLAGDKTNFSTGSSLNG